MLKFSKNQKAPSITEAVWLPFLFYQEGDTTSKGSRQSVLSLDEKKKQDRDHCVLEWA